MHRIAFLALFLAVLAPLSPAQQPAKAMAATGPSEFKIAGAVTTPLTLSLDDLKKMPRKTLRVENSHTQKTEVYEGVPLEALLQQAGAPHGDQLKGATMATYVLVEAADNYRVVYSLAELDAGILDSDVLLADTMDGAPLATGEGPFKLVAPHDKRPARWVRMLKSITVVRVAN